MCFLPESTIRSTTKWVGRPNDKALIRMIFRILDASIGSKARDLLCMSPFDFLFLNRMSSSTAKSFHYSVRHFIWPKNDKHNIYRCPGSYVPPGRRRLRIHVPQFWNVTSRPITDLHAFHIWRLFASPGSHYSLFWIWFSNAFQLARADSCAARHWTFAPRLWFPSEKSNQL